MFTSGRISKIFWRAGSVTSKLPPVGGDALRSSVIPSPFHLVWKAHGSFDPRPLIKGTFVQTSIPPLKPQSAEGTWPCQDRCWTAPVEGPVQCGMRRKRILTKSIRFNLEILLKWITFATRRCLNALVPLSRGLDQLMWSPATSLFSDSKTYLGQKDVTMFPFDLPMDSLCYRVEKSCWPSWRLILVWLPS